MSNNNNLGTGGLIDPSQLNQITQAITGLNANQLNWMSGYMAGLAAAQDPALAAPQQISAVAAAEPAGNLTIIYGSQTGNAKGIAVAYQAKASAAGIPATVVSMADYKPRQIKNETHVAIIVSTHGEGEAPDDAVELHEFLGSKKAPKLPNLKYAVLGLGDTSYEFFCQTAKDFDTRLATLGATAVIERVDCDVDYDSAAAKWQDDILAKIKDDLTAKTVQVPVTAAANTATVASIYSKKNPFSGTLLASQKITGRDSVKDIRHIEISLEESGIQYQAGDALGVYFLNDADMVTRVIAAYGLDANASVTIGEHTLSLAHALTEKCELTLSYPTFVKALADTTNDTGLVALLADKTALREYLVPRQIVDIAIDYPVAITAQQLVDACRPLTARLYSIASSQAEVEDEVHLTVALVEYDAHGFTHQGGASGYLSTRLEEGAAVKVYVESNDNFRLPADPNTPVIMVGPGTGIAPFRAFMQERDAQDAQGSNWLFFGNPNFTQDFLYQTEWQGYVKSGLLSKVSLAFSRDQAEKVYVQHRLVEQGAEVYKWLEQGAHFYVCGDANHMAKDVEQALLTIYQTHGKQTADEAKKSLLALRKAKRYQKDVY
ncbi:MAG: assimilatory sulfite reductase (NADPH) flavoprotein subunit [Glaciecola sp.]|jgi:sulfite reductase (NADPH) flavoprotein alpha-component|nr:assimilatory sulfite reductase (NADPH) flavoprotein subunit [Glaciecola sp.]MDG1468582.1 assimilatory sulfite reductase (NADPH) flavoprotein subunit [Glaciecola sp.]MDG1922788.1 assimilatory sulfite reductase (NADPH) flavoprotein subunit [Glaciecola sp.]